MLLALDDLDLSHLWIDLAAAEAAIDDADASLFGDRDRHLRSRDRVHVRGHDWPLQRQARRETAGEIDGSRIAPLDDAVLRLEEKVVERGAANEINQ